MTMKIVAGMGSVDDYIEYAKAGADEVFIGFVPDFWQREHGLFTPLNRREVCYYNVQIGSESELEHLAALVKVHKVPVTIAINGLNYRPEHFPIIQKIIERAIELSCTSFIIADLALMVYLKNAGISTNINIHVSGELSEINHFMVDELCSLDMKRLIFHRKVSIQNMADIIKKQPKLEYEAFLLNEMCHFNGAFCNSLHCDELVPMCRMPYQMGSGRELIEKEADYSIPGASGCGLCALWNLREAGVTHLKVVGRGLYSEDMIRDIGVVKKALCILEASASKDDYIANMKAEIFNNNCSENCYYR